jgi:CrcB protein
MGAVTWAHAIAVAVGASIGAVARWLAGLWLNMVWAGFPLGTLFVNCVGGLLIGIALVWFDRIPNEALRLLWVTGFLGGLTTFSSFSGESLVLLQRGEWTLALGHTVAHLFGCLACAALGFWIARAVLS